MKIIIIKNKNKIFMHECGYSNYENTKSIQKVLVSSLVFAICILTTCSFKNIKKTTVPSNHYSRYHAVMVPVSLVIKDVRSYK